MPPILSILIPAYNRPEHLDALLSSIFSQLNSEIEIIVSDDCSPKKDKNKSILEKWKAYNRELTYYIQEKNIGEVGNKNFLLDKARGLYILFMGDDDLFEENAIYELLKLIKKNKNINIFILGHKQQDDFAKSNKNRRSILPFTILGKNLISCGALNFDWFPFHFGHPASYIFQNHRQDRNIFKKLGFAEDLGHLSLCLLNNELFYFTDKCFFIWRKDTSRDQINQSNDEKRHVESRFQLFEYINDNSSLYSHTNLKINKKRFFTSTYKKHGYFILIKLVNILAILFNYFQIFIIVLLTLIKEKFLKSSER